MFKNASQVVTRIKSSLPSVQELPGCQKASEVQVKTTKKPGPWSKFGTFKVDTKKTQETSGTGGTIRRRRKHRTTPGLQTYTRHATKNLKWKRANELKEKSST